MNAAPLIDRAVLDDLFESIGEEGGRAVLDLFIGECGAYLAAIAAAKPGDAASREAARRAAHSLKSGAGQIGAAALATAAAAVEREAAGDGPGLLNALAAVERSAAGTLPALRRFLAGEQ